MQFKSRSSSTRAKLWSAPNLSPRCPNGCYVTLVLSILIATQPIYAAGNVLSEPVVVDAEDWKEYLPKFLVTSFKTQMMIVESKHLEGCELQVWSTDSVAVSYSDSRAQIRFEGCDIVPIELHSFKHLYVNWIDESHIEIESWPGRCVEIQVVVDIVQRSTVNVEVKNHCGIETGGT